MQTIHLPLKGLDCISSILIEKPIIFLFYFLQERADSMNFLLALAELLSLFQVVLLLFTME